MSFHPRQGSESSQIGELRGRLIRVVGARIPLGGEVVDLADVVRRQQVVAESLQIQLLVGRAFEQPVKQVEAVDINVSFHAAPRTYSNGGLLARRAPAGRSPAGELWVLYRISTARAQTRAAR